MLLPHRSLSDDVRWLYAQATLAARELNHEYIGTEHLALGVCKTPDGAAARLYQRCGGDLAALQQFVLRVTKRDLLPARPTRRPLPHTSQVRHVAALARESAGRAAFDSEHLLLAMALLPDTIAGMTLRWQLNLEPEELAGRIRSEIGLADDRSGQRVCRPDMASER